MSFGISVNSLPHVSLDAQVRETDDPYLVEVFAPIESATRDEAVAAAAAEAALAIEAAIERLIGNAPTVIDTISEIAAALGNDPNLATTLTAAIAQKASNASPNLTGQPKAPTPLSGDNSQLIATTAFIAGALSTFAQRKVSVDGLASGGGDLSADRTISVPKANQVQAEAALLDTVALTPMSGLQLIKAQFASVLKDARTKLPTSPDGLASGEPWLNANTIEFVP